MITVDRPAIVRFIAEIETGYATEIPEKSARWLIDRILSIAPDDVDVLTDAALDIERSHTRMPSPASIATSIATKQQHRIRYGRQDALPRDAVEIAASPFLERMYPGEDVTWNEHVRRVHEMQTGCASRNCEIHRSEDELEAYVSVLASRRRRTP